MVLLLRSRTWREVSVIRTRWSWVAASVIISNKYTYAAGAHFQSTFLYQALGVGPTQIARQVGMDMVRIMGLWKARRSVVGWNKNKSWACLCNPVGEEIEFFQMQK